jgi:hypothetical protein
MEGGSGGVRLVVFGRNFHGVDFSFQGIAVDAQNFCGGDLLAGIFAQ